MCILNKELVVRLGWLIINVKVYKKYCFRLLILGITLPFIKLSNVNKTSCSETSSWGERSQCMSGGPGSGFDLQYQKEKVSYSECCWVQAAIPNGANLSSQNKEHWKFVKGRGCS